MEVCRSRHLEFKKQSQMAGACVSVQCCTPTCLHTHWSLQRHTLRTSTCGPCTLGPSLPWEVTYVVRHRPVCSADPRQGSHGGEAASRVPVFSSCRALPHKALSRRSCSLVGKRKMSKVGGPCDPGSGRRSHSWTVWVLCGGPVQPTHRRSSASLSFTAMTRSVGGAVPCGHGSCHTLWLQMTQFPSLGPEGQQPRSQEPSSGWGRSS